MQENDGIGWNTIGDKMPILMPYYESFKEEFPIKIKKKYVDPNFNKIYISMLKCVYTGLWWTTLKVFRINGSKDGA